MIVKNIVIRNENSRLIIDIKDCDMNSKKLEQQSSKVIDTVLEEILKNKDTLSIIKNMK